LIQTAVPVLEDTVGLLQLADISHDLSDIVGPHGWNRRHVAIRPVMRPDALLNRAIEGAISVMVRLVDAVNERWPFVAASSVCAVATRAVGRKKLLALLRDP